MIVSVLSAASDAVACEACGRSPARRIVVRRHVGLLVLQRFISVRVHACRPCGRGLVRSFTAKTLWQGWWGAISFFFNWFVLATNLRAWRRLGAIENPSLSGDFFAEPVRGFGSVENSASDEPKPLLKRRFRLRTTSALAIVGVVVLGLVASAWDATHHDHDGAHGLAASAAMLQLAMTDGPFAAEDGSTVGVKDAVCNGQDEAGTGEAAPGGYTHFDCMLVFDDGTSDEVVVHLLANDEIFFVSAEGSAGP